MPKMTIQSTGSSSTQGKNEYKPQSTEEATRCVRAAAAIMGDKWTPLLINALYARPESGFCLLQDELGGINPRTLSARLRKLEEDGIIAKCQQAPESSRNNYYLTEKGRDLWPILQSMQTWSLRHGLCELRSNASGSAEYESVS